MFEAERKKHLVGMLTTENRAIVARVEEAKDILRSMEEKALKLGFMLPKKLLK
jgi:hypothetical protein